MAAHWNVHLCVPVASVRGLYVNFVANYRFTVHSAYHPAAGPCARLSPQSACSLRVRAVCRCRADLVYDPAESPRRTHGPQGSERAGGHAAVRLGDMGDGQWCRSWVELGAGDTLDGHRLELTAEGPGGFLVRDAVALAL